jgi:sulfide:quinone oxidoreductase
MKRLLILGAGTAGTLMANRLRKRLNPEEWTITIADEDVTQYYRPGFLFVPFGIYSQRDVIKPKRHFVPHGVDYLEAELDRVEPENKRILLRSGERVNYDVLIVATGVKIAPEQTKGMLGTDWGTRAFDFYTFEGASALHHALRAWKGGRLVVHVTKMPITCPVAPLEFAFLADSWLIDRGLRNKTEVVYVTPGSDVFTSPLAAEVLGHLVEKKRIKLVTNFQIDRVDNELHKIVSWDGREADYDLLVTVPTNTGDVAMGRSGLADQLNFVLTNDQTLQTKEHSNIFVLGDATDLTSSKSSYVAHFQSEILTENIVHYIKGEPLELPPEVGADCFVQSRGKAFSLDSDHELQTVEDKYLSPVLGPLSRYRQREFSNLAFQWIYGSCWPEARRWRELALARPNRTLFARRFSR